MEKFKAVNEQELLSEQVFSLLDFHADNKEYFIITDQDEELLLFGFLFHSYDEAAKHAIEHMVMRTNWRVVKIKLYKVL